MLLHNCYISLLFECFLYFDILCLNLNFIFYETSYCDLLCIDVLLGSTNGTSPIIEGHFEFIEGKGCGESCNR